MSEEWQIGFRVKGLRAYVMGVGGLDKEVHPLDMVNCPMIATSDEKTT